MIGFPLPSLRGRERVLRSCDCDQRRKGVRGISAILTNIGMPLGQYNLELLERIINNIKLSIGYGGNKEYIQRNTVNQGLEA